MCWPYGPFEFYWRCLCTGRAIITAGRRARAGRPPPWLYDQCLQFSARVATNKPAAFSTMPSESRRNQALPGVWWPLMGEFWSLVAGIYNCKVFGQWGKYFLSVRWGIWSVCEVRVKCFWCLWNICELFMKCLWSMCEVFMKCFVKYVWSVDEVFVKYWWKNLCL